MITLHCWGKCVNINSLIWTLFLNQFWLSLLTLDLIWVNFPSQYRFFPVPFESKSIISQNHTSLLDKDVEENDSVIIFENWKLDGDNFFNKTIHSIILLLDRVKKVTGRFLQDPWFFDWAATVGPIRPPPEPPPWGNFPSLPICFKYIHIHDALRTMCMR